MNRVVVVGAGAAGMMAAVAAAEQGAEVVLLEKMDQAGRKLRITGKGRCNLTNTAPIKDFITHIGPDGRWMRNSFSHTGSIPKAVNPLIYSWPSSTTWRLVRMWKYARTAQ